MERLPSSGKNIVQDDKFLNALADAYRLQEAIISTTELVIISTNIHGIITSFNKAAETLLGYTAKEVIGKSTPVMFHDLDEILKRTEQLSKELNINIEPGFETFAIKPRLQRVADRREWTYVRKDGSHFPVILSVSALRDEGGELTGYAGIATDISEQKHIHQKIKESESHLQALINSIDDVIYEVNEEGRYLNLWAKNEDFLFLPKRDIIGRTLAELFGEKFSKPFDDILKQVLTSGKAHNYEYRSLVQGDERWFNAKYAPIFENRKLTKRVSISIQDITARKKAEFALKESEQKFRLLAENIPGIIFLCHNDKTFSMIYLNDKVEEVTGYKKEEFLDGHIHFSDIFHPADKEYIYTTTNAAVKDNKSYHLTYRIRHKSGEVKWLEEYGIGVYFENQLLWLEGFMSDITHRKMAEDELIRIADENNRVFNYTLSLNAIIDSKGHFKKVNPAWEKTLGWHSSELLSQSYIDFVHPDDAEITKAIISGILAGKEGVNYENRYKSKDGGYRWLLWTSSFDKKRNIIYASALDITERKRAEDELIHSKHHLETVTMKLQEQNRQLDEFAHIISHNLRSPVGNIQALISFLNDNSSMQDYKLIFDKLKNVAKNLGETMNELMDTMTIKTNSSIEKSELRFKDILDKVIQSLEGDLIKCEAHVTFDFNKAPKLHFPKTYLESILQNLLSNAIKYRSPERTPVIHFESDIFNGQVELRVADNGLGIDMERYGQSLFGLHKTFHENAEARGVGLFLTKTQIETLGGTITAESEVDKGTTFIIRF